MNIEKIAVIGAGFMGSGIAQVSAQAGYRVALMDIDDGKLDQAHEIIAWSLTKLSEKGKLTESVESVMERLSTSLTLDGMRDADLVIEAVFEDIAIKANLFRDLDASSKRGAILASNTSTIPITTLANATQRPGKVIGIHFFGPVALMKLVEVIPNPRTDPAVTDAVLAFTRRLGKNPVLARKDIPGFIMNRVFGAMVAEAVRIVETGVGSVADVDQGMCDGFNLRVGPLAIADGAGLDVVLNACRVMYELDPDRMPPPPPLLERLVAEGKLGAKAGQGFYHWAPPMKRLEPAL